MNIAYNILVVIAVIIAIAFSLLVLVTGKGDAMSGGGSVRTTFKGKASFDDIMSRWTLYIGAAFMFVVLVINVVSRRLDPPTAPVIERSAETTLPSGNAPANTPGLPGVTPNAPATNSPAPTNNPSVTGPTGAPGTPGVVPNGTGAANGPLDSTPATVPSANVPTADVPATPGGQPSVVPSVPGSTTTGGTANAAPPVGSR